MSGHALRTFSEKPTSMPNQDSESTWPWASSATAGGHRSVCISEMTTAVLHRMGIVADVDHLCETDWRHLCQRAAPCPACQFVAADKPWAPWFDWFYVEMMKCAQTRGCQHEDWWDHFDLHDINHLPRAVLPPLPNRADSRPPPPDVPSTSQGGRREPKERQRAKSGGSLLVWECIGVHSAMERSAVTSFGGRDGGFWGRFRVGNL